MSNLLLLQEAAEHAAEPAEAGLANPAFWVASAMLVVFAVLAWKKVHKAIASALDEKIAQIRSQLDEAAQLRRDAEALKAEYEAKAKSADKERKAMIDRAHKEADEIVAKADADAAALIERRSKMAEEKIAAEERAAIEQLRSAAADAATRAAARLIADRNDAASDKRMVSDAIKEIAKG
jgi:F-type H+-transporting ATPase subunit b